ncbi:unnamed protein product [Gordionus sp. m RMFG-2023]
MIKECEKCPSNKCHFWGDCICEDFKYGKDCEKDCKCDIRTSSGCDHAGKCLCKVIPDNNQTLTLKSLCLENQFCDTDGSCRCKGWKYRPKCDRECSCNKNNSKLPCDYEGRCTCKMGYYGQKCYSECPNDCQNSFSHNSCSLDDGRCLCRDNYYGLKCEKMCNCEKGDFCDMTSGKCRNLEEIVNINIVTYPEFDSEILSKAALGGF